MKKTIKVRPILIESKEKSCKGDLVIDPMGLGIHVSKTEPSFHNKQQLILISLEDEKIEVGELCYNVSNDCLVAFSNWPSPDYTNHKKVIATQSQLPSLYIQEFIIEYNEANVKDFEIEITNKPQSDEDFNKLFEGKVIYLKKPKLTNSFITIVEKKLKHNFTFEETRLVIDQFICEECPEYSTKGNGGTYLHKYMKENGVKISKDLTYSEEEVKELVTKSYNYGAGQMGHYLSQKIPAISTIDKWFEENKKK